MFYRKSLKHQNIKNFLKNVVNQHIIHFYSQKYDSRDRVQFFIEIKKFLPLKRRTAILFFIFITNIAMKLLTKAILQQFEKVWDQSAECVIQLLFVSSFVPDSIEHRTPQSTIQEQKSFLVLWTEIFQNDEHLA